MLIHEAQREVRTVYLGGFVGQSVAATIWALSAAASTWISPQFGMMTLFFVSMFLFPLTQLILRLMKHSVKLSAENTLGQLATQIAFTVPIGFILVAAATLHRQNWFYPASMVIVGAHYLPFIFLYGMRHFGALAAALILGGIGIGLYLPDAFSLGGWFGAVALMITAFAGWNFVWKEERSRKNNK